MNSDLTEQSRGHADALLAQGRLQEAVSSYDGLIATDPRDARSYNNRGKALRDLHRFSEAVDSYRCAIALLPDRAELHSNLGNALWELERFDEALESYDTAIRLDPDYAEATWNKALLCLLLGRFEEGWQKYEARKQKRDATGHRRFEKKPLWLGDEPISGKALLVHWEQGYGDVIQFSRYLRLCEHAGARVLFAPQSPLKALMCGLDAKVQIVDLESDFLTFDCHCPIMSLPHAFRTEINTIPRGRYLFADDGKVAAWARRLGPKTRSRIGVVWNSKDPPSRDRIIGLEQFRRLFAPDYEFISLQKHVSDGERTLLRDSGVRNPADELFDFSDTAALCCLMDLVISIDTSVAHLAGALDVPVWLLLPKIPEWRWMLGRDDSPWYESMRLFRQRTRGDWDEVLRRVRLELRNLLD